MASLSKNELKQGDWLIRYFGKEINKDFKTIGRNRKKWSHHVTDADLARWRECLSICPWETQQNFLSREEAKKNLEKFIKTWEEMASQLIDDIYLQITEVVPYHYEIQWYNPADGSSNQAKVNVETSS